MACPPLLNRYGWRSLRVVLQSNRLPDEVFDGAVQSFCESQCRGNRGAAQVQLVLLVELYGTEFDSRLGGQLLLCQAGRLTRCLETFSVCLDLVPFIDDKLSEFIFGSLMERMVRGDYPIERGDFE